MKSIGMGKRSYIGPRQGFGEIMPEFILHATSQTRWAAALETGSYSADSLLLEGFIHCSTTAQILHVVNTFFPGQHGLVLLVLEPGRLTAQLRWEPGLDLEQELFPHVYGAINLDAVVDVIELETNANGKFLMPESLKPAEAGEG